MQRAAAARMFVRGTELLVCDDLSSALDVEQETRLTARVNPTIPRSRSQRRFTVVMGTYIVGLTLAVNQAATGSTNPPYNYIIAVINQSARANQPGIRAQLRLHNTHRRARCLHRSLLDNVQSGFHQHWTHLGDATTEDDHLGVKAMDNVDKPGANGLRRILDDSPCQRHAGLGGQGHCMRADVQFFLTTVFKQRARESQQLNALV